MATVTDFRAELERQVLNHSIYVWATSGQRCKDVSEKWIREHEARCQNGKYADAAVKAWREVMSSPYADVARCFDCSGYVSYALIQIGALDKRRDCDGLYDRCTPLETPENGALLFKVSSTNPNDETHVGAYYDGAVYESKGRAYGVVKSEYKAKDWKKIAWFKALPKDEPSPEPQPEPPKPIPTVKIKVKGSVRVRKGNGVLSKKIATVKDCTLPYLGQAVDKPNWYMTNVDGQYGYITNNPKYTQIVEVEW